jgi:hypothetical protein
MFPPKPKLSVVLRFRGPWVPRVPKSLEASFAFAPPPKALHYIIRCESSHSSKNFCAHRLSPKVPGRTSRFNFDVIWPLPCSQATRCHFTAVHTQHCSCLCFDPSESRFVDRSQQRTRLDPTGGAAADFGVPRRHYSNSLGELIALLANGLLLVLVTSFLFSIWSFVREGRTREHEESVTPTTSTFQTPIFLIPA